MQVKMANVHKIISIIATIFTTAYMAQAEQVAKPNIIFIMADDLGFNDIGYHAKDHFSGMKTPYLDKLASEGVKLESYYVQPTCTPTRSQLLTGRLGIHTGVNYNAINPRHANAMPIENKLMPEYLRECGYDTHMIGKWHLGHYKNEYLPWNRGFNSFYGFLNGDEDHFTREKCHRDLCGIDLWSSEDGPVNNTWGEYSAHLYARKAMEVIDNRDHTKPFFLFLSYQSVHSPLQAPEEYIEQFAEIKNTRRRRYAGMVLAMDESVKNVTEHLKKAGMLNNTIIVFSSDNGGERGLGNNWPLRGRKRAFFEGGVRTVGFVHGEPLGVRDAVHNGLLHVSDWLPTFLRAGVCAANHTLPLDGYDQWDAIRNKSSSPRNEILHHLRPIRQKVLEQKKKLGTFFNTSTLAVIRNGPWKLMTGDVESFSWELPPEYEGNVTAPPLSRSDIESDVKLFDIANDPYEQMNVASENPDIVRKLLSRLAFYQSTAVPKVLRREDFRSNPSIHKGFWGPWM